VSSRRSVSALRLLPNRYKISQHVFMNPLVRFTYKPPLSPLGSARLTPGRLRGPLSARLIYLHNNQAKRCCSCARAVCTHAGPTAARTQCDWAHKSPPSCGVAGKWGTECCRPLSGRGPCWRAAHSWSRPR
jgi:hypothetical protein